MLLALKMTRNTPNIPDGFRRRYQPLVDDPEAFLAAMQRPLTNSFRINRLKATSAEVLPRFEEYGIMTQAVSWYDEAFTTTSEVVSVTLERFLGKVCLQELASMLPPLVIADKLGTAKRVLDGCAAPGSKTTQMAALMNNRGLLVANDSNYDRIRALKFNLNRAGVLNSVITEEDLRTFPQSEFDVVLLDAPCSSEGMMRKNPLLWKRWSEHRIRTWSGLQKQLILKAFDLLASGGTLLYSTCTIAPEENETVIDWLLQNRPAKTEPIEMNGFTFSPALPEWLGTTFDNRCAAAVRVWPHHNDTGAFFLARVSK
ncbi:MAG: RsmB/NOP family class I SAM-dependent RNA methyltransferase [bacterium]